MTLFDPSTATLTNQFDLTSGGFPPHLPLGIEWKPDGTRFYTINLSPDNLIEWECTTPFDLSTAVFVQEVPVDPGLLALTIRFKEDGTRVFFLGGWIELVQQDLSTPWDISTMTPNRTGSFKLINDKFNRDFDFNKDGTEVYVVGDGQSTDGADDRIYKILLPTPFDLNGAAYVTGPNPSRHITENIPTGFSFNNDGTKMFVHGVNTFQTTGIFEYNLSPPYNYKSGANNFPVLDTSIIENQITIFPESLHTLRFAGNPKGSKLYFTSGWYLFGGSPNTLYEMSMSFTKTTREKNFGSVGVLIKALGSNGNCGGINPLVSQSVIDNFIQIPTGTLAGQRLSISTSPVRVTSFQFVIRRDGLSGSPTGTLVGKVRTNSTPNGSIGIGDEVAISINTINVEDLTTDPAGEIVTFNFDGTGELTESDDIFIGVEVDGSNEGIFLGTESTGDVIPGGDYVFDEDCVVTRLRSNRNGSNISAIIGGSWSIFPLSSAHSDVLPLGEVITHIRVTRGINLPQGGASKFRLAIYSGPGNGFSNACASCATPLDNQLRATTSEVSFDGLGVPIGGTVDIPLQGSYVIDSSDHNDIQVCFGVRDGDLAIGFKANSKDTLRKRISFAINPYPNFPSDWLDNGSDLDNEAPLFLLLGPTVVPDAGTKCFTEEDGVDLTFNVTIETEVRQRGCFSIGADLLGNVVTRTTDPDQFKIGAKFKFTTGRGFGGEKMAFLQGTSGETGGIPPVEPKINALLQRTVGMGGIGNEPEIGALLSTTGATVTKFTCINYHVKRLGINGTEGAGLKSFGVSAFIGIGTQIKETFIGAKLKFPKLEEFFTSARLVGENTKIKTFESNSIIIVDFNTNGGNGITKPFLLGAVLSKPFKQFSINSIISIPAGVTPFKNFSISAVIEGLTIEFDLDACVSDPFQTLESESVLGIGGGGVSN